ncbi:hypothetical protein D8B26_M00660 (mitochondrion) [Coccidioides posadasii str. Silveira]|uniref:uncharacterized protein n=1 Tax=Coccidioides posadasii (strain RMSCC 757 / Silveira) TaxID=443226 RepID=UPI001D0294BD|nr:hypothetical protein LI437_mgp24 [Coccidioides posadasii]QVG61968.1 hypothetical protein [Coccidioides posadasii]UKA47934.1 hypothetical protein D8B26_M00660 [Coccidioides posadasii str. Silveira]
MMEKVKLYRDKSLNAIKGVLGIHYVTCTNCIKNGESYLNFFKIRDTFIDGATKTNLSISEIVDLIDKIEILKKTSKFSKSIKKENEEEIKEFSSITAAVNYLKGKDVDRN